MGGMSGGGGMGGMSGGGGMGGMSGGRAAGIGLGGSGLGGTAPGGPKGGSSGRAAGAESDPVKDAEEAVKALREARDKDSQRRATEALDKALEKLKTQDKAQPGSTRP
jgi:hypothetical protein